MNEYVTGTIIKELREKYRLTQTELADKINVSANMMRSLFYVCPICGNIFHGMGEAVVQCHGIVLTPCQAEETDEGHMFFMGENATNPCGAWSCGAIVSFREI